MVDARVRYWEDAEVNGVSDAEGSLIPFREGNSWKPSIELATGKILGWPMGTTADIHYKICDDGDYWLADSEGNKLYKWAGNYVPDRLLCVGESGYGDYIILKVREDGRIADWVMCLLWCGDLPLFDTGEWVRLYPLNTAAAAQVAVARMKPPISMTIPTKELMRGVRVDGDEVVISVKGGNEVARKLCAELVAMIDERKEGAK
jgi:hypothetical protein